jgi:hypothetical protein
MGMPYRASVVLPWWCRRPARVSLVSSPVLLIVPGLKVCRALRAWPLAWPSPSGPLGRQRLRRSRVRAGWATATGENCCVVDGAWERREAIRQLAELRRRLTAAEDALTEAHAAMKRVEAAFDAASDAFTEDKQAALDAAREQRARAREARYAAQQAHERASTAVARLQRRVTELSERLDRMTLPAWGERGVRGRHACGGPLLPRLDPPSDQRLVCPGGDAQLGHPPVIGPPRAATRRSPAPGPRIWPAGRPGRPRPRPARRPPRLSPRRRAARRGRAGRRPRRSARTGRQHPGWRYQQGRTPVRFAASSWGACGMAGIDGPRPDMQWVASQGRGPPGRPVEAFPGGRLATRLGRDYAHFTKFAAGRAVTCADRGGNDPGRRRPSSPVVALPVRGAWTRVPPIVTQGAASACSRLW